MMKNGFLTRQHPTSHSHILSQGDNLFVSVRVIFCGKLQKQISLYLDTKEKFFIQILFYIMKRFYI